ncbi:MAG: hypothetical protein FJ267_16355 [Planctomycetes bacterium]|nr:hypothetical protein [Planctomycetota bacterium]
MNDVRRYVEDQAKLWREKNQGPQRVVIKAEGDVSHGTVEEVARQIKSVEGVELYMGVGEKPQE